MKDTIKANLYYKVKSAINTVTGEERKHLYDGNELIMSAKLITMEEHNELLEDDECYHICEVFTTCKGNQFIYSRDEESDEDFLVKGDNKMLSKSYNKHIVEGL